MRPPRVSVITFTAYICCIYALKFGQYWTSFCVGNSSVSSTPYIQFLFVRPRFCLRLPSDSASQRTPLSLANSSYCQACSGLPPPSYYACRAHYKNKDGFCLTVLVRLKCLLEFLVIHLHQRFKAFVALLPLFRNRYRNCLIAFFQNNLTVSRHCPRYCRLRSFG